jgi:hypothetical protein
VWRRPGGIIGAGPNGPFDWFEQCAATRASELCERGRGGRIERSLCDEIQKLAAQDGITESLGCPMPLDTYEKP